MMALDWLNVDRNYRVGRLESVHSINHAVCVRPTFTRRRCVSHPVVAWTQHWLAMLE